MLVILLGVFWQHSAGVLNFDEISKPGFPRFFDTTAAAVKSAAIGHAFPGGGKGFYGPFFRIGLGDPGCPKDEYQYQDDQEWEQEAFGHFDLWILIMDWSRFTPLFYRII